MSLLRLAPISTSRLVVVEVAERLSGVQGPEAVSLRSVAREAGVAPAAASHHFGKGALIAAVVACRSRPSRPGDPRLLCSPSSTRTRSRSGFRRRGPAPAGRRPDRRPRRRPGSAWKVLVRLALDDDPLFAETLHGEPGPPSSETTWSRPGRRPTTTPTQGAAPARDAHHADRPVRRGPPRLRPPARRRGPRPGLGRAKWRCSPAGLAATSRPRPTGPTGDPA